MKHLFFLLLFSSLFASGQNTPYDSLEHVLASEKTDTTKLKLIQQLVDIAFKNDMKKALEFADMGGQLADKIKDKNWQPKFYEMQGRMHANLLHLDTALYFFNKAMDGYVAVKNTKGQATTAFKMAWVYKKKGENEKALEKDLAALKLVESINDKQGICDALTRVSTDLTLQERLKEAEDYAQKAIAVAEQNQLDGEKFYVYFNAGNVAIASAKFQQALDYYNQTLAIAKKQNLGPFNEADITNSRGNALKKLGRYAEALQDYKTCNALGKQSNYPMAVSASIANIGEVNLLMGNYKEALPYQLETVRMQEADSDMTNLVENYDHVSKIYEKLGDYKNALLYKQKAYSLHDSIASIASDAAMSKLLTQYETKKKEATITAQQSQISQQKKIQWLTIGTTALFAVLLLFSFISYRNRSKSNRLLAAKNNENELLLKEIHHRVKNNLEVVSSLLALQSAQIDDPNTKEAMLEGQNRVHSIGIVHQKLYQGTSLGAIEMKDYFLNLSESILDSFGADKRVKIELAMEKLDIDIDTAVPLGLIVNELLTNTIKYAFPQGQNGNVKIKLEKQLGGNLRLEVSDNGVGKGEIIQGSGFGGQLITLLTKQLGGKMTEEINNGTHTYFDFKINKAA
ncbi:MAG: tetratricopeptide repeat protein [Bacteroidetes bacterium]|nr:tetratricopeptide repeat protein [Bacteroidota bacterium]MBS1757947.1 tetratricopeptide repeat protein [Bacteroidota bacterium]